MKILLISPFFYPEKISTGKYNTILAEHLSKDNDVTILCSHPLYPSWQPKLTYKEIHPINIKRGGYPMYYPSNALMRRLFLEVWFSYYILSRLMFKKNHYDLIISIYPPNLASTLLKLTTSCRAHHIGIIHDIQGVLYKNNTNTLGKLIKAIVKKIEELSYCSCNALIFLSREMMEAALKEYPKIKKIPNQICYPFITVNNFFHKDRLDKIISKDTINLVYSGALGDKQAPQELIKLLNEVSDIDKEIKIYIFSQGAIYDRLKQKNTRKNIFFYSLVDEIDLPELLIKSTVQIIPQDINITAGAFPSKLPNILASNVKVFCVTSLDSEVNSVLSAYSKSFIVNSWENENLAKDLIKFSRKKIKRTQQDLQLLAQFDIDFIIQYINKNQKAVL